MTTKEEILAQAGEPVAWKDTCLTTDENDQQHTETVLLGYEGADLLPDGTDLYTADQVIAARKGLEQEVERLKVERDNHQLDINAELRQQLAEMTEIARKEYLSAIDWAGKHQELSEQLAEKDAEIERLKEEQVELIRRFQNENCGQTFMGEPVIQDRPVPAKQYMAAVNGRRAFRSQVIELRQQLAEKDAEIERLKGEQNDQLDTDSDDARTIQHRELDGAVEVGQLLGDSQNKETGNPKTQGTLSLADTFRGDDAALLRSVVALIELDLDGALVPHGIGGHARSLLSDLSVRLNERNRQLAEKDAELINYKRATDLAYKGSEQDTLDKLAAAQAREQQLRKLIENAPVSSGVCCCGDSMDSHQDPMVCGHSPVDQWDWAVFGLLKETPDTTALEALIAKAGEVMRERSATVCDKRSTYYGRASAESQEAKDCAFNIRALPGVTLEDLK